MAHWVGPIDGKHVTVECPTNSGSLYCNFKGFFDLVLLAVCDAKYTFTLIDIGSYGSNNDCGMSAEPFIGKKFDNNKMNLLFAEDLASFSNNPLKYFLVRNEILSLKSWFLRLCPGNLIVLQ